MYTQNARKKITIVGAGMGGSLMAIYLAKQGFNVEVYERRGDMRREAVERGLSINMTLSERSLQVLAEIGLLEVVMRLVVPLKGRIIHTQDRKLMFQPYGKNDYEVIYSVKRHDLNVELLNMAQSFPNVKVMFHHSCTHLNVHEGIAYFQHGPTGQEFCVTSDVVIGADGVFSIVRQQIHRTIRSNFTQEFIEWGYKELSIPPGPSSSFVLEKMAFHLWPRGSYMLMAVPNLDGSFTCTCILPFKGDVSFASMQAENDVSTLFKKEFNDVMPYMPTLIDEFLHNPVGEFVTTSTTPWYYKNHFVLLGDACHSFVPFYGQGMSATFEDCSLLNSCIIQRQEDWTTAFAEYQRVRKRNTDVMADLSKENFIEIRDKVKSPLFVVRKRIDIVLNQFFPHKWMPLYTMIMHTTIPYADAKERFRRQERIVKCVEIILTLIAATMLVIAWKQLHQHICLQEIKVLCKTV